MNPIQQNKPFGDRQWVNLVNAPPICGQIFFGAMFCSRSIGSTGVTSPPVSELFDDVSQQFTRFAFRA